MFVHSLLWGIAHSKQNNPKCTRCIFRFVKWLVERKWIIARILVNLIQKENESLQQYLSNQYRKIMNHWKNTYKNITCSFKTSTELQNTYTIRIAYHTKTWHTRVTSSDMKSLDASSPSSSWTSSTTWWLVPALDSSSRQSSLMLTSPPWHSLSWFASFKWLEPDETAVEQGSDSSLEEPLPSASFYDKNNIFTALVSTWFVRFAQKNTRIQKSL